MADGQEGQLELTGLFSHAEALAYVRGRLQERGIKPLSREAFRTHVYDVGKSWHQLEPIRLGWHEGTQRAGVNVYTRRLLDEYLENYEHNQGYMVEKRVAQPTAEEVGEICDVNGAMDYLNQELKEAGVNYVLSQRLMAYHRERGNIPAKIIGRNSVYLKKHLDAFVERMKLLGGWGEEGIRPGPTPKS